MNEISFNKTLKNRVKHKNEYTLTAGQKVKLKDIFSKLKEINCTDFESYEFLIN